MIPDPPPFHIAFMRKQRSLTHITFLLKRGGILPAAEAIQSGRQARAGGAADLSRHTWLRASFGGLYVGE